MKKQKSTPFRRRLFLLIFSSMLVLLLCISGIFMYLTQKNRQQSTRLLTDYSDEMISVYKENEKSRRVNDTGETARSFLFICQQFISAPVTHTRFSAECDLAYYYYLDILNSMGEAPDETLFVYYKDFFYSPNGKTQDETEQKLNAVYADEHRQCEVEFEDPDGVQWVLNNQSGDSYIETDNGLITVAFAGASSFREDQPIKIGIIREWDDKSVIVSEAQRLVAKQTETAERSRRETFRKGMLFLLAAMLAAALLSLLYTRRLAGMIADPIELEQKRAQQEKEALEEANRMKTTFLSDASHELKTPLAAMSGYAQNAEYDILNGGEKAIIIETLRRISSEANRMALMVTQILDATRIEEGRMVLEKAPCDLDSLVRRTVETYFAVLNKNNNRLAIRIPLELPPVEADSARLQRVLVNLISNALKHTHNGTILIKAEAENDSVRVTVRDTGCGISEEDMPHIWERYYKGKQSETGTGLGLFICKFIVESHGGSIFAESERGKGTAFHFTLPVAGQPVPAP